MKAATCALAVSVFAATTAALATTTTTTTSGAHSVFSEGNPSNLKGKDCVFGSSGKERFAPRIDGLRFIETLVTAHR